MAREKLYDTWVDFIDCQSTSNQVIMCIMWALWFSKHPVLQLVLWNEFRGFVNGFWRADEVFISSQGQDRGLTLSQMILVREGSISVAQPTFPKSSRKLQYNLCRHCTKIVEDKLRQQLWVHHVLS